MTTPRKALVAALLSGLVSGSAAAQSPPDAAPLSSSPLALQPNTLPNFGPVTVPPTVMPAMPSMPMAEPAPYEAPVLATDSLGGYGAGSHGPRGWFGAEYLLYWTKEAPVPFAVATVGPANGNAVLGAQGTQLLYGNTTLDYTNMSGIRVIGGYWLTNNESLGLEGNFFILPRKYVGTPQLTATDTLPTLARPFTNTATNQQNTRILTKPGQFIGNIATTAGLELWGAEIGPVWRARDSQNWSLDYLTGFRFLSVNESLNITDVANTAGGGVSVIQGRAFGGGSSLSVSDTFRTINRFYGVNIGARANLHVEAFTWSLTAKVALGWMDSTLQTTGTSTISGGNLLPITSQGGFYASGAALGNFDRDQFAAVPEFSTNLNVQITSHIGMNLGYNFLYVSKVLRPGDQITGSINPNGIPSSPNFGAQTGPANTVPLSSSGFYAQGFNLAIIVGY